MSVHTGSQAHDGGEQIIAVSTLVVVTVVVVFVVSVISDLFPAALKEDAETSRPAAAESGLCKYDWLHSAASTHSPEGESCIRTCDHSAYLLLLVLAIQLL